MDDVVLSQMVEPLKDLLYFFREYSEKLEGLPLGQVLPFLDVAGKTLSIAILAEDIDIIGRSMYDLSDTVWPGRTK